MSWIFLIVHLWKIVNLFLHHYQPLMTLENLFPSSTPSSITSYGNIVGALQCLTTTRPDLSKIFRNLCMALYQYVKRIFWCPYSVSKAHWIYMGFLIAEQVVQILVASLLAIACFLVQILCLRIKSNLMLLDQLLRPSIGP